MDSDVDSNSDSHSDSDSNAESVLETMWDPVGRLPPELASQCFAWLAVEDEGIDRLAASHVSRNWRRAALAERRMWAALFLNDQPAAMLAEFLLRSHPFPFALTWKLSDLAQGTFWQERDDARNNRAILDAIRENLARFWKLKMHSVPMSPAALFAGRRETPLPVLTTFKWRVERPARGFQPWDALTWPLSQQLAPRLSVLELRLFTLPRPGDPQPTPMPTVRTFSAHDLPAGFNLAAVLPNLEKLRLRSLRDSPSPALLALPESLRDITLDTSEAASGDFDFGPFFRACIARQPKLRLERLDVGVGTGVADGIRLFLDTLGKGGEARLDFVPGELRMQSADYCIAHVFRYSTQEGAGAPLLGEEPDAETGRAFAALLTRMCDLTVTPGLLRLLDPSALNKEWDGCMPLLRELSIADDGSQTEILRAGGLSMTRRLHVPRLENITLSIDAGEERSVQWLAGEIPRAVRALFDLGLEPKEDVPSANAERKLARITVFLDSDEPELLLAQDSSALRDVAHALSVGDSEIVL